MYIKVEHTLFISYIYLIRRTYYQLKWIYLSSEIHTSNIGLLSDKNIIKIQDCLPIKIAILFWDILAFYVANKNHLVGVMCKIHSWQGYSGEHVWSVYFSHRKTVKVLKHVWNEWRMNMCVCLSNIINYFCSSNRKFAGMYLISYKR